MPSLFSRIIGHEVPGAFVFEGERWVSFLDLFPVRPGHALLVPRSEGQFLGDLPMDDLLELGPLLQKLINCVKQVTGAPDAAVILRDGPAAGQVIPHVHWHVIPRQMGDDEHDFLNRRYAEDDRENLRLQAEMAAKLTAAWNV
jgi:histidine triad (HIT) family protein